MISSLTSPAVGGSHINPSLASDIVFPLDFYLQSDKWAMQQKMDGKRMLVKIESGKVTAISRNGKQLSIPQTLASTLARINGNWVFDGELVEEQFWVFDVLLSPLGEMNCLPWNERFEFLSKVLFKVPEPIFLLPAYLDSNDKQWFLDQLKATGREGVVFKHREMSYIPGRAKAFVKYKFTHTVDCIVIGLNADGKDNYVLGLYHNGEIIQVGKVIKTHQKIDIGDILEVKCLYATSGLKLFQPTSPKLRADKTALECTTEQLYPILPNKKILTGEREK